MNVSNLVCFVSVNKSHNWNSLKHNNLALAAQNEKLKFDLKLMHDHCRATLKKNNELTQENFSLHRLIDDPTSFIEEEVNRRLTVSTSRDARVTY